MQTHVGTDAELAPQLCDRENCSVADPPGWNSGEPLEGGADDEVRSYLGTPLQSEDHPENSTLGSNENSGTSAWVSGNISLAKLVELLVQVELASQGTSSAPTDVSACATKQMKSILMPRLLALLRPSTNRGNQQPCPWPNSIPFVLRVKSERLIAVAVDCRHRKTLIRTVLGCAELRALTSDLTGGTLAIFPAFKEGFKYACNVCYRERRAEGLTKKGCSSGAKKFFDELWLLLVEQCLNPMLDLVLKVIDEERDRDSAEQGLESVRSYYDGVVENGGASFLRRLFNEWTTAMREDRNHQAPVHMKSNHRSASAINGARLGNYYLLDGFATMLAARCAAIENREPVLGVPEVPDVLLMGRLAPSA
jgi:hypothetical protein